MTIKLLELAKLFLKLGVIGFGGPAVHIGMMEDEIVTRRKWMSREYFLDLVGATNLIPGPNSTEMTMHVGYHQAGLVGMVVAGSCFIVPAVLITGFFAWMYAVYGEIPQVAPFLYGIKPAVIVIILNALWKLGQKALKGWKLSVIGAAVLILSLAGINEVFAIFAGGILGMLWIRLTEKSIKNSWQSKNRSLSLFFVFPGASLKPLLSAVLAGGAAAQNFSLLKLFLVFLKVGAVLFGSGYVLIAFLEGDLVHNLQWLTEQQLLDAIAVGQFTPGPMLSTSTFIGYQIAGFWGAVVATLGIFLPSFFFVAISNPFIPKLRKSIWASAFLDSVNMSAVGLMAAVILKLGYATLIDWQSWVIAFMATIVVLSLKKLNSAWLVLSGMVLGYLLNLI